MNHFAFLLSCVQGLSVYAGNGNIGSDPLFADPPGQDYRLSAGSPCIDAGDNSAVPVDLGLDLGVRSRRVDDLATTDTGLGTAPFVDMGAYEYYRVGDTNSNGIVNLGDVLYIRSRRTEPPSRGDQGTAALDVNLAG